MLSIYRLPNKLPNEKVIKVIRKDLFILIEKILLIMVLIVLPIIVFYLVFSNNEKLFSGELSQPIFVLGASAYYLFIWLFFFFSFIDYYLDVWIVTSERILDIRQEGFFSRTIAEQKIFRIQDVTSEVKGIIPTILHYGDVHVQTAGTVQRFHFDDVPYPDKVRDMVIKLVQRKRAKQAKEGKKIPE